MTSLFHHKTIKTQNKMAKERIEIPSDIAARVLFLSDRTCCVCRQEGKKVQIHHLDENPANNFENNLAVLCFECHTETMLKGGFHRKLDAEQILLYRNDWLNIVVRKRNIVEFSKEDDNEVSPVQLELATSIAEIYRENEEYELLAMHYHNIDNIELRDKYIEKVLSNNPSDDTIIFLKNLQGKGGEVSKEIVERQVKKSKVVKDWLQMGRIYNQVDDPINAVKYYLKGIEKVFGEKNYFTTAFYLKEMFEDELIENLFIRAYNEAKEEGDLWWQVRALQELNWDTELENMIKINKEQIIESQDINLMQLLAKVEKNDKSYIELVKKEAASTSLRFDDSFGLENIEEEDSPKL